MRKGLLIGVLAALTLLGGLCAADAGAVVVQTPHGKLLGVTPRHGVSRGALGSVPRRATTIRASSNGNLDYLGGPVLHSSAPYLIFWDPSGSGISSASRALLTQYFNDVAADNGHATNVYAVNRQFTDGSGLADYSQAFSSSQAISDTQPYPARDLVNCSQVATSYPKCLTDDQLQAEINRLIGVDGLPKGLGANAPIYFIVTPADTNICDGTGACASDTFCAYHTNIGSGSSTLLYAAIPLFFNGASSAQDPKACQYDGHNAVQEPNGDIADVALKYLSHEDAETITDPTGTGWWDTNTGNEDGDNCNDVGTNSASFTPTLGGNAAAGTLYNQSINSHHYYIQSEWSNGDVGCEMKPSAGSLTPSFSAPGSAHVAESLSFDPSASTSSRGITSATWDFGDGATSFTAGNPATVSHAFTNEGTYTVKLTLVDGAGNASSVSDQVQVGPIPTAAFSFSPTGPVAGDLVNFNGSGSSDPNAGATLTTYSWNFGDGSPSVNGVAPAHTYTQPGSYTVTLTVTDNLGLFDTTSHVVDVAADELPSAQFAVGGSHLETGFPISFDGSASADPDGSIVREVWDFGDGSAQVTGATTQHVYTRAGSYTVVLTVQDSGGQAASVSRTVTVSPPGMSVSLHGRSLRVSVDQPGTVSVQQKHKSLSQPGTVTFKLTLTKGQKRQLHGRHALKLKLKVVFTPAAGQSVTQQVKVRLRS